MENWGSTKVSLWVCDGFLKLEDDGDGLGRNVI